MSTTKRANDLSEVRDELCRIAAEVMDDARRAPQAHEAANALGKVINSCKVYLEYCALAKDKPNADWGKFIAGVK